MFESKAAEMAEAVGPSIFGFDVASGVLSSILTVDGGWWVGFVG
jgi:hypothetical protein